MNIKTIMNEMNLQLEKNILVVAGIVLGVGVLIAASMGAYYVYGRYQRSYAQNAQLAYADLTERFQKALESADSQEWQEIAQEGAREYAAHSSSPIAPLFLAWQSQALDQLGNTQESLSVQEKMINELPSSSPAYGVFATKYALILLDQADAAQVDKGKNLLEKLAADEQNKNRDIAQYYLGEYYASIGDTAEANKVWRELADQSPSSVSSPWAEQAQQFIA